MFGHSNRYLATHPWAAIRPCLAHIKWARQRLFRGWDDRVVYDLDYYLCKNIPSWLRVIKQRKRGVPVRMYEHPLQHTEADVKRAKEKWNQIVDEIIEGFEAADRMLHDKLPICLRLREEEEKRFGKRLLALDEVEGPKRKALEKELDYWNLYKQEQADAIQKMHRAMDLLKEYLFTLGL